jgi:Rod binding domain-containing protein
MNVPPVTAAASSAPASRAPAAPAAPPGAQDSRLRTAFDAFVGESLFGQMLKGMRKTLGKPAYFYGGRTEEVFQQQLDQVLAAKLSAASSAQLTGPMFELFTLQRR